MYHVLFQHSEFKPIFYGDKHGIEERWMCLNMIAVPQIEGTGYFLIMINCTFYRGATLNGWVFSVHILIKHQNRCVILNKDAFLGRTCFLLIWCEGYGPWMINKLTGQSGVAS